MWPIPHCSHIFLLSNCSTSCTLNIHIIVHRNKGRKKRELECIVCNFCCCIKVQCDEQRGVHWVCNWWLLIKFVFKDRLYGLRLEELLPSFLLSKLQSSARSKTVKLPLRRSRNTQITIKSFWRIPFCTVRPRFDDQEIKKRFWILENNAFHSSLWCPPKNLYHILLWYSYGCLLYTVPYL